MSKILKNTTGSIINLEVLARDIPASSQITVEVSDYILLASSDSITELTAPINSGDIVVNDGVGDLLAAEAIEFIKYPDHADNIRFTATTIIAEDTVQEAIEAGVSTALNTPRYTIPCIYNGTLSNNEFIGYSNLLPGDNTPIIVPIESILEEYTFSNKNSNADYTIELRKNSTIATVFSAVSKVNTASFVESGINESFNAGDAIYIKYIDDGNNASDLGLILVFRAL